jgi:hypothetical protein
MDASRGLVYRGLITGNLAGLASMAALAWRGRQENGSALAPLNAPSHWLWGDRALWQDGPSWRYTAMGVLIHQASAVMWGLIYERLWASRRPVQTMPMYLRDAAVGTAAAATVDLVLTPKRFTPGFERRLSPTGLVWTYGAFALGVAMGSYAVGRQAPSRKRRP